VEVANFQIPITNFQTNFNSLNVNFQKEAKQELLVFNFEHLKFDIVCDLLLDYWNLYVWYYTYF